MPPTIVATPGAPDANSFVTVAAADAYVDAQMVRSLWPTAADDKARALIAATADISALTFTGARTAAAQSLSWPRTRAADPDAAWSGVVYYDAAIIPRRVRDATCELAYRYAVAGAPSTGVVDSAQNVLEKTVDVLTTRYADPAQRVVGLGLYPRVAQWLRALLRSGTGLSVIRQ